MKEKLNNTTTTCFPSSTNPLKNLNKHYKQCIFKRKTHHCFFFSFLFFSFFVVVVVLLGGQSHISCTLVEDIIDAREHSK